MRLSKARILLSTILGCLVTSATAYGESDKYFGKPYDATVSVTDAKGVKFDSRTICDGKGHLRTESKTALGQSVTLMDFNKKTMATVMETEKMIFRGPIRDQSDPDPKLKRNVKQLGEKTINGHPCKGESYELGKTKCEVWTGTDINYPVKSIVDQGVQKVVTELKSFSNSPPASTAFEIPATGYKEVGQH